MEPVEITAGSLHLRPVTAAVTPASVIGRGIIATVTDPASVRWLPVPTPYTPEDARTWLARCGEDWDTGHSAQWAVLDATTGDYLAGLTLRDLDRDARISNVGISVHPQARGRGVAATAVRAAARWAFGAVGVERLEWYAAAGNAASISAAQRAGFRPEGVLRSWLVLRDGRHDAWLGSLLPGEA
ncbi:MAG TPA: GNAT family N-acetyltransferase [Frankiaceae bacterium]